MPLTDIGFLFDDNPNPMWIFELSTLRILKVNTAAIIKYGYSEEEFLSMTTVDIRPKSERSKFGEYLKTKRVQNPDFRGFSHGGIWKHQAKGGDIIYADITSHDVRYKERNCRVVVATDVTERMRLEEEARLREKFLTSLIDSQTNFLIRLNVQGLFTFVNQQFLKAFDYKREAIIGAHFSTTIIEDEYDLCLKAFHECIATPAKVIHLTHKKVDNAGNLHDTQWEFIAITDDEGTVTEIQGVGQDVTEKLSIEREIKQTAEKMDSFIESITDAFFIVNKEWRFIKVNRAFEAISGKSRFEVLGNELWDIFPRVKNTRFEEIYRRSMDENLQLQITEYYKPFDKWLNVAIYPSFEGLTVFIKDISEEKRAQQELIWTKNSLEALINNTEDQIWSIDIETRYVYMNQAYRSQIAYLTGFEPKEGDYSNKHLGYTPDVIERWNGYYKRAFNGEIYTVVNESVDPLTKETLSFEISFNPIFQANGLITGIGCFARNITQRLKTEKAIVDQNERLRHIASLTSHELRRPVASMLGLISIMDRQNFYNPDNKEIIEHLFTVGNEIDEVIRLIVDKTFTDPAGGRYGSR